MDEPKHGILVSLSLKCGHCGYVSRSEGAELQYCAACNAAMCPDCVVAGQQGVPRCVACITAGKPAFPGMVALGERMAMARERAVLEAFFGDLKESRFGAALADARTWAGDDADDSDPPVIAEAR